MSMGTTIVMKFFLTGAGTASFAAYRAIKSKDPTAKILIVGDENRLVVIQDVHIDMWLILMYG